MSHFCVLEDLAHLAPLTEFFRDAGTELFKAHKAGTVPVLPGQVGPLA